MGRWIVRILGILLVVVLIVVLFRMQAQLIELQNSRAQSGQTR